MDGGGAPPGGASARRSCCGRPQHSLARWPRTISLFCRPSAARSAEPRSANVTNAQCRVSSTCAAAAGALNDACFSYSLLQPSTGRSIEHHMLIHCVQHVQHVSKTWSNARRRNQPGWAKVIATFGPSCSPTLDSPCHVRMAHTGLPSSAPPHAGAAGPHPNGADLAKGVELVAQVALRRARRQSAHVPAHSRDAASSSRTPAFKRPGVRCSSLGCKSGQDPGG